MFCWVDAQRSLPDRKPTDQGAGLDTNPSKAGSESLRYTQIMVWFFERQGQRLQYEIHRAGRRGGYELTVSHPGKKPVLVERFDDPYSLQERALQVERSLTKAGWRTPHFPSDRPIQRRGKDDLIAMLEKAAAAIL